MNTLLKLFDYFFLTRPILFFPGWATMLAGYVAASDDQFLISRILGKSFHFSIWVGVLILGLTSFCCAMGGCFVLNQLQDIDSDRKNGKLFLLSEGHVSARAGYIETFILLALALVLAAQVNMTFLSAILVFIIITGYLYNYRPFILKNRPWGGTIANMLMGWIAFLLGWSIIQPIKINFLIISLPYLFFNTSLYFLTTLPDQSGDYDTGKKTLPVQYGVTMTIFFSLVFWLACFILAAIQRNEFLLLVCALNAPFILRLVKVRSLSRAVISLKAGITAFALVSCVYFPVFLIALAILFFFTRFYYHHRFHFDYPNFRGR